MPSSVVHAAFALLLAVGLLGSHYNRKALGVLLGIILIPELDTLVGWVMDGAHRTVLHTMLTSLVAAGLLYWETTRANSWIRRRWGAYGVRVAWVGLFVHTFAHLALDWSHLSGINVLWPIVDQFATLDGEVYISTTEGFVQTIVNLSVDPATGQTQVDAGQGGTTRDTHVSSPVQPSRDPGDGPADRRFPIAARGWQLYVVLTGLFALVAKTLQRPPDTEDAK